MRITSETKVTFRCESCKKEEIVMLKDLPTTPKKFFILPVTVQCISCLRVVPAEVKEEDNESSDAVLGLSSRSGD